ncbi:MAG: helix-turn-helix transcriptional regulator, partial [Alphaproteobacteria bacterium]
MQNRIKELRQSGGMTAAQLADQVGTSASQIVKLERGERRLTQEWMIRLAAVLGCAPADIMGGGFLPQDGVYDAPARPHPAPGPATGLMETQRAFLTGQPPAHSGFADVADLPVLGAAKGG